MAQVGDVAQEAGEEALVGAAANVPPQDDVGLNDRGAAISAWVNRNLLVLIAGVVAALLAIGGLILSGVGDEPVNAVTTLDQPAVEMLADSPPPPTYKGLVTRRDRPEVAVQPPSDKITIRKPEAWGAEFGFNDWDGKVGQGFIDTSKGDSELNDEGDFEDEGDGTPGDGQSDSTTTTTAAGQTTTSVNEGFTSIWGRVLRDGSGKPVEGVTVIIHYDRNNDQKPDSEFGRRVTNANGWYDIQPTEATCYGVEITQGTGDPFRWVCLNDGDSVHVADGYVG